MRRSTILEFLKNTPELRGERVKLRHKRLDDAIYEYNWRKDEELCKLDATTPIVSTFQEYLYWYADNKIGDYNSFILAIDTLDNKYIGNCGCFNIDDIHGEMELGIMIGEKQYWNQGYGEDVIKTLINNLVENTQIRRIYLRTLEWNLRAQKCFEKCEFKTVGKLERENNKFIIMEWTRINR